MAWVPVQAVKESTLCMRVTFHRIDAPSTRVRSRTTAERPMMTTPGDVAHCNAFTPLISHLYYV